MPDNVEFLFAIWNLKFFKFFQNVVTGACPQYSAEAMLILITDLSNKDKNIARCPGTEIPIERDISDERERQSAGVLRVILSCVTLGQWDCGTVV